MLGLVLAGDHLGGGGLALDGTLDRLQGRLVVVLLDLGVAVVELSSESLLMSSSAPKTAAMLADLGYRVVTVDISEFEKLEGCVTCLSVRVR